MKHAGKAAQAGRRVILWTFVGLVAVTGLGVLAAFVGTVVAVGAGFLFGLWVVFSLFALWFFRDPEARPPLGEGLVLAAGHGKVDAVEEITEPEFMGGRCRRVSTFLSVFDVHVQKAPVAGRIVHLRHTPGQYLNAMQRESAVRNENVLVGIEASEPPGEKIGVRLIAGLIARRIVPWTGLGDTVARGERISLIQFGSRVDLYLPLGYRVTVKPGDRVRGGETVVATRTPPPA